MSSKHKQLLWLTFFSIAMGLLEAAVVIYLRYLYYPDGFRFPLTLMAENVVITELLREVATLIMLVGVAVLAGRTAHQRFAFFLIAFGVWDIFYYVFLKLLLGWPESLLTWDILFLLPVPWVGPVLTPCLVSLTMILMAGLCTTGTFKIRQAESIFLNGYYLLAAVLSYFFRGPGIILSTIRAATLSQQKNQFHFFQPITPKSTTGGYLVSENSCCCQALSFFLSGHVAVEL